MERYTKIALVGFSVAISICVLGYIYFKQSENRVSELVIDCESKNILKPTAVEVLRSENRIPSLSQVATIDEYAKWIVENEDKKGSSEFEAVAKTYRLLRNGLLICDPSMLQIQEQTQLTLLQKQIVKVQANGESWSERSLVLAGIIIVVSIFPYTWYFFLRRVRELRDAVIGK
ncbi:MAG: hypothetical protein CTY10_05955 [Methylotenera sp.]|nr:MAG: hypothetical protein CTY10_05955 [Methylotenera sp.]